MNILKKIKNNAQNNLKRNVNLIKSVSNPKKFIDNLKYGHSDYSYSFREVFEPVKNEVVHSLEIIRNPLSKPLQTLLSAFTGFQLEQKLKQQNFDDLFHLKIRINGKYDFEKEQAAHFRKAKDNPNQEPMKVSDIPNNLTIEQLVENTRNYMGNKFFNYDGLKNNCQDFILAVLHSNHIHNSSYDSFIKQNTDAAFKSTPSLMKQIMNKTTDIANRAQILTEGTGIKENYKNVLSNFDLIDICKRLQIPLKGVIMKDQLTNGNFQNGNYIMNLNNSDQSGSHWVAFIKYSNSIFYCDSYGIYPPEKEWKIFLNNCENLYVNTKQFQPINSDRCGYYSILFLHYMKSYKGSKLNVFKNYLKLYDYKNLKNNDKVKNIILSKL